MRFETERFWNSQLENAVTVPDFAAWQERHESLSAVADRFGKPKRIPTGPSDDQAVWRSPLGRPSSGLIFIHGGYWRRYKADHFAFVAETASAADATFYNVDYRLMPSTRMADVVADAVAGCAAAMEGCETTVIVGHSAGAHLAIEAALRLDRTPTAVVAISGLYDLDPLRYAFIQDELELTEDEARDFSPQSRISALRCPVHVRVGANETVEFRRQSARLFESARASGADATIEFVPGQHHSSVVAELADTRSVLSQLVQNLLA